MYETNNLQYVATLREQLEQLSEEKTPQGLPRFTYSLSYWFTISIKKIPAFGVSF